MHFGIDHHDTSLQIDHGLHEVPKSGSGHLSQLGERDRSQWKDRAHGAAAYHDRQPGDHRGTSGSAPREAVATQSGREAVIELLKQYESVEFRKARAEERDPVRFDFLWQQEGLDRASQLTTS